MKYNNTLMKINRLLELKNWSIYKLAKESEIAYSSLNNIFLRDTEPTLPTLRKICKGLNITLSEFFADDPPILKDIEFNKDEKKLIELYQKMKLPERKLLIVYANGLIKQLPE